MNDRSSYPDRWNRWFTRLVQLTGLLLGVHEALMAHGGRSTVFLYSAALILGPQGVRLMIRGLRSLGEGEVGSR